MPDSATHKQHGNAPPKGAVVVPTIRREHISHFLEAWRDEFAGQYVVVIEDNPERTVYLDRPGIGHYSWKEIDEELGTDSWIIPRRTDCIRSFGFYKAWQRKVDFIVSLDDDCLPASPVGGVPAGPGFIAKHWEMLSTPAPSPAWVSTVNGEIPRVCALVIMRASAPRAASMGDEIPARLPAVNFARCQLRA